MDKHLAERWQLALTGAVGGAILWALTEALDRDMIGDRMALVLLALAVTHFAATLAMAGPIGLWRALPRGLGLGLVTAALIWLAGTRYESVNDFFNSRLPALAALIVATLPVPFLIATARGRWNDYGALFLEAWSIVVCYAAAWAFTGLVWLVIFLSDQVLRLVGVTFIADLLDYWIVPMVLVGAILGLGMAVVHELADLLSPYLVLRLFRLLLPVVLGVMLVFLIALPFRGIDALFNDLSPVLLLLLMVAAGVSLVSIAVDQSDADAAQSPVLQRATQGMALVLPVVAGLAIWAVWLRVGQHGWTPERLFVALTAGLGLVYGLAYAMAVLRGAGWMERIRQANIRMALLVILLAGLWLTPVLNAERIAANSQLARFVAGQTPVADLDVAALKAWGRPGAAVLAVLAEQAKAPGQEELAARLGGAEDSTGARRESLAGALAATMPVQPATATGMRDTLLASAPEYMLTDWQAVCDRKIDDGGAACLLLVADLLPALPGEEAMLILGRSSDYVEILGLYIGADGMLITRSALRTDGRYPDVQDAAELLRAWRDAPPPLTPAPLNQLGTGDGGLLFLP